MKVKVNYYGHFRELLGIGEEVLEVGGKVTVGELLKLVLKRHPELEKRNGSIFVSVNHRSADSEKFIKEGDQVSIFPPVGGG